MKWLRFLSAVLLTAAMPVVAAAQTGVVTGTVTNAQTNEPVANATVQITGAALRTVTNTAGEYTIRGVPAGNRTVSVNVLGFAPQTRTVTVAAGASLQANFALNPSVIELGALVVTATGAEQRQREIGNSVSVINVQDVNLAPVSNFSELLQGRAAGVAVLQSTGTSGAGARVRIRGSNSISLNNDPLLIIDGIRVESATASMPTAVISLNGQNWSRWNDINPEEIESIEVIKGPAAAALYGTAAANGVVQITTRRGRSGPTQYQVYSELGRINDINTYPTNMRTYGWNLNAAGQRTTRTVGCRLELQALGACEAVGDVSYNPIETHRDRVFRQGQIRTLGGSISGGGQGATYFVSGEAQGEDGVYTTNEFNQVNLRGNITAQVHDNLNLSIRTGYISNVALAPYNDNAVAGIISGAVLGCYAPPGWTLPLEGAVFSPCGTEDGWFSYPLSRRFAIDTRQRVERFITSSTARWQPMPWLTVNSVAGLDLIGRDDTQTVPPGIFLPTESPDNAIGNRTFARAQIRNWTLNNSATAVQTLTEDVVSTTTLGGSFHRDAIQRVDSWGYGMVPGTTSLGTLSERFGVNEVNQDQRTLGIYASQQFGFRDRFFLTAAARGDRNSNFGEDLGFIVYPSVSGAWVVSEEPFFPAGDFFNQFRLRAAYGQSGLMPGFRAAQQFFSGIAATIVDASVPAVTMGGTGNPELRPERSREFEFGLDASILNERLGLEFTYYDKASSDALIQRLLPPSLGMWTNQWVNLGRVSNRGMEALLNARILDERVARWDATFSYSTNRNRLVTLGEGVEPIIFGIGGNSQRHEEGFPLGGYWAVPYTFEDRNGDNIIDRTEIVYGIPAPTEANPDARDLSPQFVGTPFPRREIALTNTVTLFNNVRLSALVDHKGGHKLLNHTEGFRCNRLDCAALYDPATPLWEQARTVARLAAPVGRSSFYGYMEDADFTKLREVSLTFGLPRAQTRHFGMDNLTLTLSGRNLATWTNYTGFDPEMNSGGQLNFSTFDFLGQPPVRTWVARVDVAF
jgi:TonB-dependent starch-binding outer membrane protein SusC